MAEGKFDVLDLGTDSSGRRIFMTRYMHDWWEARVAALGFRPVIVQGAFMLRNGGGARASDHAHDGGGCLDVRTRDLTTEQIDALVKECRLHGGAAYRRDKSPAHGGMDPHCHITLGSDDALSDMARTLWRSYLNNGDGLAAGPGRPGNAPDYEFRPDPLVLEPPQEDLMVTKEDEDKIRGIVRQEVRQELARLFRDEGGDGVDIGRARVISKDGKHVSTLADLLFRAADRT